MLLQEDPGFSFVLYLALGAPQILSQQGRPLDDADQPFSGTGRLTIRLFDAETEGTISLGGGTHQQLYQ